jgi:hypothetical protein
MIKKLIYNKLQASFNKNAEFKLIKKPKTKLNIKHCKEITSFFSGKY